MGRITKFGTIVNVARIHAFDGKLWITGEFERRTNDSPSELTIIGALSRAWKLGYTHATGKTYWKSFRVRQIPAKCKNRREQKK